MSNYSQNFLNCYLGPATFMALSTLKLTVLLRGQHLPTVTMSLIWTSLKQENRCTDMFLVRFSKQLYNLKQLCYVVEVVSVDDGVLCSSSWSPHQMECTRQRHYQWRGISCQYRCSLWPSWASWSSDWYFDSIVGTSPCQLLHVNAFLILKDVWLVLVGALSMMSAIFPATRAKENWQWGWIYTYIKCVKIWGL